MDELFEVTWFQFENLIKGRVPFLLINHGAEISNLFPVFHQAHVNSIAKDLAPEEVVSFVESGKFPKHYAVLVLCPTGEISSKTKSLLEQAGFNNVFYNSKGLTGLIAQKD